MNGRPSAKPDASPAGPTNIEVVTLERQHG
jgi:hypothetical protein